MIAKIKKKKWRTFTRVSSLTYECDCHSIRRVRVKNTLEFHNRSKKNSCYLVHRPVWMSTSDKEKIVSHFRVIGANRIVNRRLMLISQNSDFFFSLFFAAHKNKLSYIYYHFFQKTSIFSDDGDEKKNIPKFWVRMSVSGHV